ncbi:MAG: CpsD/CapB family tyrosine-protein kinase, partial [Bacteroidetes bacterium]|nr:CpsD/CapB family tyrosine-protein kinase [Bacteroidota bacterium]
SEKESGKLFSSTSERNISIKPTPLNTTEEKGLVSVQKPHSHEAEQFRVLKNSLLFPESGNPPRTVMITSTSHGEGKSFVASNLAVAIASSIDEHVLLLDCDLHNPTVHSMFGIENDKGLSTYLSHGDTLSSLLKKTFLQKLTILPGGPLPSNPSDLITSDKMRKLIIEAEARYEDRYILLDAPPPLITSETNALAKHVNGIILVVKHGYTQKNHIQDIIDIYGREKILGVVYNFAKDKFGFQFGNKYKYGYKKKG